MEGRKIIKPYKKDLNYSYAPGAYAAIELLAARPEQVQKIVIHPDYNDADGIIGLCGQKNIGTTVSDKAFKWINQKENTYVLGLFTKYTCNLQNDKPHAVLVNPSDMGNLGTIIRTLAGFNILNLAVITPAADIWNPKTVRASMGAVFRLNIEMFTSFDGYRDKFSGHSLYPFMLDGKHDLNDCPQNPLYSLIFGNEATGLSDCFHDYGTSIRIPYSGNVDSLNLSVAVGIGAYAFAVKNGQIR